ncbi:hypothetical protein IIA16_00775 [bacterium]|nr:hypothetical protein [bacterium]
MDYPGLFILARALHVAALAHWLGGVAFVTTVVLPAARSLPGKEGVGLFLRVEATFSRQARWSVAVAGLTGLWMLFALNGWWRFSTPGHWWLWAMVVLWALYAVLIYILEPQNHARMVAMAAARPATFLARVHRLHLVLVAISLAVLLAGVAGSHGWRP